MFVILHVLLNSSTLLNPDHKYPSTLTWIHRYATQINAPFSRMKSISEKFMHQFWGWAVHHCYTNVRSSTCAVQQLGTVEPSSQVPIHAHVNTQISNHLQCTVFNDAKHPWKVYASILGVSCPPLLHWCSQCCICCSIARHYWTLSSHIIHTHVNT